MYRRILPLALLAVSIALAIPVRGAALEIEDHETVYGMLNADGSPSDITVVDWLRVHGQGEITIVDPGDLQDVRNVKGPERPDKVAGGLSWHFKNSHDAFRDIFYSGRTTRSLPVEIKIAYILNGKEVPPKQVGGAKGELLVRMTITNRLKATERVSYSGARGEPLTSQEEFYIPLVVSVTTDVDSRQYRRIDAPDGTSVATGSTVKISWIVFPTPTTTLTMRLTGDRIRVDPITFSVAPKMPPLPAIEVRDQLVEMVAGMKMVDAGLTEIANGTEQLTGGYGQLVPGVGKLQAGVADLSRLNEAHQQIVSRTVTGLADLDLDGISASLGRMGELQDGLVQLEGGLGALIQLNGAHQQIVAGIADEIGKIDVDSLEQGVKALSGISDGVKDADRYLSRAASSYAIQTRTAKTVKDRQDEIQEVMERLEDKNPSLSSTAEFRELKRLAGLQRSGLFVIYNGGREAGKSYDGMNYTNKVLDGLAKKMQESKQSLTNLEQIGEQSGVMLKALDRLKEALKVLATGGTLQGKVIPGLDKAGEGVKLARDGVATINAGVNASGNQQGLLGKAQAGLALLRTALGVLLHGGVIEGQNVPGLDTAGSGLAEVGQGLQQVRDGINQSQTGAIQIRDGVGQVRTQGSSRLYQGMATALDELTKVEALKKVVSARVQAYDHFIGKPAGAKGEVRFLLRTETLR